MTENVIILRGIVRGGLTPGPHDSLIEMLGHQSRRISNHLILNIAEACVDRWPLTVADYNQPRNEAVVNVPVKFTVRNDLYPKLYQRYKSLAQSIRTTVFLNMLNRYAELARVDPEGISAAMRDMEFGRNAKPEVEAASSNEVQYGTTAGNPVVAPATPPVPLVEVAEEPAVNLVPDVDPMSLINAGL